MLGLLTVRKAKGDAVRDGLLDGDSGASRNPIRLIRAAQLRSPLNTSVDAVETR